MSRAVKNYKTWVEVDKKALRNNAKIVRGLLKPDTKLMAVVKSNAYGHGLAETARLFCNYGADWIGVDNLDEAILLRKNKITKPILVMGYTPAERLSEAVKHDVRLTIYDLEIPRCITKTYNLKPNTYNLHLKIDTGMSRQGITLADLPKFLNLLNPLRLNLNGSRVEGVFTHFANADNLEDRSYPNLQLANFKKAIDILKRYGINPPIKHACATTGLLTMPALLEIAHPQDPSGAPAWARSLTGPEAQFDMARIGIALYGLWPSSEFAKKFKPPAGGLGLASALSWKTRIVQIKKIKKGTPVGYGITERVKKDSTIAVLPVGYYDGYFRKLSSSGEVIIGGRRCKILGRISMNLSVADISNVKNPKVWDEVVLIGNQRKERITAEELAEKAGTISYEVVSRINPLLPRIYL